MAIDIGDALLSIGGDISKLKNAMGEASSYLSATLKDQSVEIDGNAKPLVNTVDIAEKELNSITKTTAVIDGNAKPLGKIVQNARGFLNNLKDKVVQIKANSNVKQVVNDAKAKMEELEAAAKEKISSVGGMITGAIAAGAAGFGVGALLNFQTDLENASKKLEASINNSSKTAKHYADEILDVFQNNFGGSIEEIGNSIQLTHLYLDGFIQSGEGITKATMNAYRLKDAFGVEVSESLTTVRALMDKFGLSSEESFNFITAGYKKGMNASDDFLDSIKEYSGQFKDMGFTAEEFFSAMETGMEDGVLGTDKVSDLFKEFNIRVKEMTDGSVAAYKLLGIDQKNFIAQMRRGNMSGAESYEHLINKIKTMKDPIKQNEVGVEIFGTMWEDLTPRVVLAVDTQKTKLEEMGSSTKNLDTQYDTFGAKAAQLWRDILLALSPFGDKLKELGTWMLDTLGPILLKVAEHIGANSTLYTGITAAIGVITLLIAGITGIGIAIGTAILGISTFLHPIATMKGLFGGMSTETLPPFIKSLDTIATTGKSVARTVKNQVIEFSNWKMVCRGLDDELVKLGSSKMSLIQKLNMLRYTNPVLFYSALAASVIYCTYQVGRLVMAMWDNKKAQEKLAESNKTASEVQAKASNKLADTYGIDTQKIVGHINNQMDKNFALSAVFKEISRRKKEDLELTGEAAEKEYRRVADAAVESNRRITNDMEKTRTANLSSWSRFWENMWTTQERWTARLWANLINFFAKLRSTDSEIQKVGSGVGGGNSNGPNIQQYKNQSLQNIIAESNKKAVSGLSIQVDFSNSEFNGVSNDFMDDLSNKLATRLNLELSKKGAF